MRISHTLLKHHRTPCFPQIDLTIRAIIAEKKPRFLILFSHQTTSYSQILFMHPSYVPAEAIFYDYPTGCPNPCCTDDCEMIRFPRRGLESAEVLPIKRGRRVSGKPGPAPIGRKVRQREMCNWIECDVCFNTSSSSGSAVISSGGSERSSYEGSETGVNAPTEPPRVVGQFCSKCRLVKYCSPEHQKKDWEEHRRVCCKIA